jgi:hypothetical protein
MVGGATALLVRARQELRFADQVLDELYPLALDPRLLVRAAAHVCSAIRDALDARLALAAHGIPDDAHAADEAQRAFVRLESMLHAYESAPVAFVRGQRLVVADADFSNLSLLCAQDVRSGVDRAKALLHMIGRHAVLCAVE